MNAWVFAFASVLAVAVSASDSFIDDHIAILPEILVYQEVSRPLDEPATRTRREADKTDGNNHRRHKHRYTNPPFKYCCGGENNTDFNATDETREIAKSCFEKLQANVSEWSLFGNPTKDPFSCERMKKYRDDFYCISDCMMTAVGVLRKGIVDTDAAKSFFMEEITYDWLKELAADAIEKCATKTGSYWVRNGENLKCSTRAVDFKQCVWSEIILTCPDEYQEKGDYCERVKIALEDARF